MKNIHIDSRNIEIGDIFVAVPCSNVESNISNAFSRGASVVFAEKSCNNNVIIVDDARLLASKLSRFKFPMQPEICVAVTGTNGKSSVSHFLSQIWTNSGKISANLGTLGLFVNQKETKPEGILIPNLTTPDPLTFHKVLDYLQSLNVTHCVFEASSHAIDQKRCYSASLSAAAFTNLASDHLDYHKTKEEYLAAKLKLFQDVLPSDKPAVVSYDYPEIYDSVSKIHKNIISFGISEQNDIRARNIRESKDKIIFDLQSGNETFSDIEINLLGDFQVMNILCAVALAVISGIKIQEIVRILHKIKPLTGRMELIRKINGGSVYVDFAHTADGLKNALLCFKKNCEGRLVCVFGCGGNRDTTKRSEMGKIASEIADVCIVTDDNPRNEPPENIRKQIISNCNNAIEIGNRREAIQYALSIIKSGDIVAVMGKGHETQQIYGANVLHFSDAEEILAY